MSRIAFIADKSTPNGQVLQALLPDLLGKASFIFANTLDEFKASGLLADVNIIAPIVFAGGNPAVIAELWPLCPKVRWVHSLAAGVDSVVPILNGLLGGPEVPLTNAKGAFSRSLGEYALAVILHFNKQVPRLQANRKSQSWERFIMNEVHGQTVGFIGFGDIAQNIAKLCRAFGMKTMALRQTRNLSGNELADVVCYSGDTEAGTGKLEVFRQSDYVVCTLPGGASTKHACGREEFAVMKPSSVFISLGRGTCVNELALVEVLQGGKIAGAAMDVFDQEPLVKESGLWQCENLLLSPHNADLTETYMKQTWDLFLEKLVEFSAADFTAFDVVVDKQKGY